MANKTKTILIALCVFCFVIAVIMLAVGAAAHGAETTNAKLIGVNYEVAFIIAIVAGVVALIAAILCSIAICNESSGFLISFLVFVIVAFIFALVAGIVAFVYCGEVEKKIQGNLDTAIKKYGMGGQTETTKAWKTVQEEQKCCGVHYFTDWRKTMYAHNRYDKVPQSCCKDTSSCTGLEFRIDEVVNKGCMKPLKEAAIRNLRGVGITGIVLAVILLVIFLVGFYHRDKLGETGEHKNEMAMTSGGASDGRSNEAVSPKAENRYSSST